VVVFTLWLLVFSSASQIMIMSPLLPQIGEELGIGDSVLGTLVSAYSLMVGLFAILSGPVSDRIGRRKILLLGSGGMTLALLLHGFVADYPSFLVVRVLAGMAGGVLSGAAVSYIGDIFPYNRRGWATGWVMSGAAFGQIFGIPLGILIAGNLGFDAAFFLFALTMALTFGLVWFRLPQPEMVRPEGRLTVKGAVKDYGAMLRRSEVRYAAAAFFLMFLGVSLYVVYLPTWLERELGASSGSIAVLFFIGGIANVLSGPQAGKLSDRIGRKRIILLACTGLAVVMSITTLVVREMWVAYPLFFAVMVLVAMRISPFSALLTALVDDRRRGALMSLTVALGQLGFAAGGALAGPLFARLGYRSNTLIGAAAVLGMGLIVWFLIPEPAHGGGERTGHGFAAAGGTAGHPPTPETDGPAASQGAEPARA
jgi:predicted MFS family arabinose efflux permease